MKRLLSPFGNKSLPLKSLEDAAEAAADILKHLCFVDESDAVYARDVEKSLRRLLKKRGAK